MDPLSDPVDPPSDPWIRPVPLDGRIIRLTPLLREHTSALWSAGRDPSIWLWMPWTVETHTDFEDVVERALEWQEVGSGQAFVIESRADGEALGSTSYLNADRHNLRVEIGGTWITPSRQRTGVNTECKWLLLRHAFEELGANRVEFKTDSMNKGSLAALARIGAKEEGTLRNHMVRPDGSLRHSTYFSVTAEEWPRVERHLAELRDAYL